jgi:adenine phosphoribosyltransferase
MLERVKSLIRDVQDFPKPGVLFKDLTPVFEDAEGFRELIDNLAREIESSKPTKLVGIESRGFILAAALARQMGVGLVLARKPGKLPYKKIRQDYALEYGTDSLEMHADALNQKDRVVIVDDVLATGGTALACSKLCQTLNAQVQQVVLVLEIQFLKGREKLSGLNVTSLFRI